MYTNTAVALKPHFFSLVQSLFPKDLLSIFLVLNAVFIPIYYVQAVQDDISAKTIPI